MWDPLVSLFFLLHLSPTRPQPPWKPTLLPPRRRLICPVQAAEAQTSTPRCAAIDANTAPLPHHANVAPQPTTDGTARSRRCEAPRCLPPLEPYQTLLGPSTMGMTRRRTTPHRCAIPVLTTSTPLVLKDADLLPIDSGGYPKSSLSRTAPHRCAVPMLAISTPFVLDDADLLPTTAVVTPNPLARCCRRRLASSPRTLGRSSASARGDDAPPFPLPRRPPLPPLLCGGQHRWSTRAVRVDGGPWTWGRERDEGGRRD